MTEDVEHDLRTTIGQLNCEIGDLESERDDLKDKVKELGKEKEELQEEFDELEKEIEELSKGSSVTSIVDWFSNPLVFDYDKRFVLEQFKHLL